MNRLASAARCFPLTHAGGKKARQLTRHEKIFFVPHARGTRGWSFPSRYHFVVHFCHAAEGGAKMQPHSNALAANTLY